MKTMQQAIPVLMLGLVFAAPVQAHTQLSESAPANDAVLEHAPDQLQLTFSEAVILTAVAIEHDSDRLSVDLGARESATTFLVGFPELSPGSYIVHWRAVSEDTHVITGEIRFTIGA